MYISNILKCLGKNIYNIYNMLLIMDELWVKMSEAVEKEVFRKPQFVTIRSIELVLFRFASNMPQVGKDSAPRLGTIFLH